MQSLVLPARSMKKFGPQTPPMTRQTQAGKDLLLLIKVDRRRFGPGTCILFEPGPVEQLITRVTLCCALLPQPAAFCMLIPTGLFFQSLCGSSPTPASTTPSQEAVLPWSSSLPCPLKARPISWALSWLLGPKAQWLVWVWSGAISQNALQQSEPRAHTLRKSHSWRSTGQPHLPNPFGKCTDSCSRVGSYAQQSSHPSGFSVTRSHFQPQQSQTSQSCGYQIRTSFLVLQLKGPLNSSFTKALDIWFGLPNNFLCLQCLTHGRCPLNVC